MAGENSEESKKWRRMHKGGGGNAVYALGGIGALIYFLQHANSFGEGLFGILKALLWPAFLIYRLMEFLRM